MNTSIEPHSTTHTSHPIERSIEPIKAMAELTLVLPIAKWDPVIQAILLGLSRLTEVQKTQQGNPFKIREILLVHEGVNSNKLTEMTKLSMLVPNIRSLWLSRNFGMDAVWLAGLAHSTAEWVITWNPKTPIFPSDIGKLLDEALSLEAHIYTIDENLRFIKGEIGRRAASCFTKGVALSDWLNHFTDRVFYKEPQKHLFLNFRFKIAHFLFAFGTAFTLLSAFLVTKYLTLHEPYNYDWARITLLFCGSGFGFLCYLSGYFSQRMEQLQKGNPFEPPYIVINPS